MAGADAPATRLEVDEQGEGAPGGTNGMSVVFESRRCEHPVRSRGLRVVPRRIRGRPRIRSRTERTRDDGDDFGSMLVFWLAHWWSEVLGEQISAGEAFRHGNVLVLARREWPLVEAAVVPTVLLALAWAGVWSRETGAELALAAAVLQITGWALVAGRRAGWTWLTRRPLRRGGRSARHRPAVLEKLVH